MIPTYNRRSQLRRVLEAVDRQSATRATGESFRFDVIVVSDGSTDGTADMVRSMSTRHPVRIIEQHNAGPAVARNTGWMASNAALILFIDDDVVPAPECARAHVDRHAVHGSLVVIGPMLTPSDVTLSPWVAWEQRQLDKQYRQFASGEPAHARQFYTGNASVRREALASVGGFDTALRRAEDVELALRLAANGQSFIFEPAAEAHHYAERSLDSWLKVAADYGRQDVAFANGDQPWMRAFIAESYAQRHVLQRLVVRGTVRSPRRAALVIRWLVAAASWFDRLHQTSLSQSALSIAYGVNYYSNVAAALGSWKAFDDLIRGRPATAGRPLCALFVLEQTLGHITHSKNLTAIVPGHDDVRAIFLPVEPTLDGPARFVPGWSNWTIRAGIRARRLLRRAVRDLSHEHPSTRPDAMLVHSQVPAVLLGRWMRRVPTVVSLDATPLQYDELGEFYAHEKGSAWSERMKHVANRRCYDRARHLVTWSAWAKQGLVDHYDVSASKVTVIAPGVDVQRWSVDRAPTDPSIARILFVGGDLHRKGGSQLIEAWRRLSRDSSLPRLELHLVTGTEVEAEPGLHVHHGLTANSDALIELYRSSDIFCLPTLGDCLPMVLAEAGAAGLPLVSTNVGAITELVRDGETGCVVDPGDVDSLERSLRTLLCDPNERRRLGDGARALVLAEHDARRNAARLLDVMRQAAADVS